MDGNNPAPLACRLRFTFAISQNKIGIAGGMYDLKTGEVD